MCVHTWFTWNAVGGSIHLTEFFWCLHMILLGYDVGCMRSGSNFESVFFSLYFTWLEDCILFFCLDEILMWCQKLYYARGCVLNTTTLHSHRDTRRKTKTLCLDGDELTTRLRLYSFLSRNFNVGSFT